MVILGGSLEEGVSFAEVGGDVAQSISLAWGHGVENWGIDSL